VGKDKNVPPLFRRRFGKFQRGELREKRSEKPSEGMGTSKKKEGFVSGGLVQSNWGRKEALKIVPEGEGGNPVF